MSSAPRPSLRCARSACAGWARALILGTGLGVFAPSAVWAAWIEVPATADTALLELAPDFNLGAQTDLPAGTLGPNAGKTRSRMLVRFDLAAALPVGATPEAAFLRLTVTREPAGAASSTFSLHRVLVPWAEGTRSGGLPGGATAVEGEPTWDHRLYPGVAWASGGGGFGSDFAVATSGTERIQGIGPHEIELGAQALEDLRLWVSRPDLNHGWVLASQAEDTPKTARRFASRESSAGGAILAVRYTPPPAPPRITRLEVGPEQVVLHFASEGGVGYVWEATAALAPGPWPALTLIPPQPVAGERAVTNDRPREPVQFYRLRVGELP